MDDVGPMPIWCIYNKTPAPKAQGTLRKKEQKDCKSRGPGCLV